MHAGQRSASVTIRGRGPAQSSRHGRSCSSGTHPDAGWMGSIRAALLLHRAWRPHWRPALFRDGELSLASRPPGVAEWTRLAFISQSLAAWGSR